MALHVTLGVTLFIVVALWQLPKCPRLDSVLIFQGIVQARKGR